MSDAPDTTRGSAGRPAVFDVCGPLPTGVTLLEASAGTGKTFTIANLATRYVAEGRPLDKLLVITFTRMATGELRARVRERLVTACDGLTAALDGIPTDADDSIVGLLAAGQPEEVDRRRGNLAAAIAGFDAATIETTHGFCLQVLSGLGVAGDVERDVTLVEDARDLLEEVVDDLYVRRFGVRPDELIFPRKDALAIGRAVLEHPTAAILPPLSDERDARAIRRRLAAAVADEVERRKRRSRILTYDDVLTRLRDTLADDERGPEACARLRRRFEVVLVDEFQDTDPVQWEIMRRAFGTGPATLVLIGDPKQAIYAFRGADVYAYLEAGRQAGTQATLGTNWRSDAALLHAYDALFAGCHLGHQGIVYRTVTASPANREPRLLGAPGGAAALRVRIVHRADCLIPTTPTGLASTPDARELIARDLAADAVELLSSGAHIVTRRRDGTDATDRPVRPGHLAVLVRTHRHAITVRDALHRAGVPAVIGGAGSVFATEPAQEWLRLLEALERPTARDRAAAAALSCFVGWTPAQIACAGEDEWEDLHQTLHDWSSVLARRGVAVLWEKVIRSGRLPARVLSRPAGERFITDLRHIGQLLHAASTAGGLGSTALAIWVRRRIAEVERDTDDEDRSRRLESDAEAVQVLTIHRSKGLEFPVVYCPYLWDGYTHEDAVPVFHDPDGGDARTMDVSGAGAAFELHGQRAIIEGRGEDLRLLYVALTRAQHRAVVWWAGAGSSEHSPLGRLLFARQPDGSVNPFGQKLPFDDDVAGRVVELGAGIGVERVGPVPAARWNAAVAAPPDLDAVTFARTLDLGWRRTSYTGITQAAYRQHLDSEPGTEVVSDEFAADVLLTPEPVAGAPVLLGDMQGGARVGTVIHGVLEAVDFAAADPVADLRSALDAELAWQALDLGDLDVVAAGLSVAIGTPLGPLAGGLRLRDFTRVDRLDELSFELPLTGGDTPAGSLTVTDIADTLSAHLPAGDRLAGYPGRLGDPALEGVLRGYLTGSLDLVLRLPGDRFVVADYKTNRLGRADEILTAGHYRPDAIQAEMEGAHYPLQAILYTVALHRYLRWRVRDYDPARNLGGVLYLFVRGMSAPGFPVVDGQPCGVWSWQPPAGLVEALSDLFDRGRVTV